MLDRAYARQVLNHIHAVGPLTMPPSLNVRLMTANGTELTAGGGYTAGGAPVTYAAATNTTPPSSAISAPVTFTNMPACTITGIELWSGSTRVELGTLVVARTVAAGDILSFAAGAIATTLA